MVSVCPEVAKAQAIEERSLLIDSVRTDTSYHLDEWTLESSISVNADSTIITSKNWIFDPIRGMIRFRNTDSLIIEDFDTVEITFRVYSYYPRRFYNDRAIQPFDSSLLDKNEEFSRINSNSQSNQNNESDLEQRGSLSRGIIVGTNQDFALESGLDFELSGNLTNDISLKAVLTDRSIPIQPDGTTQNLKEFDRVFIQLEAPNTTLEMGDVDVSFEKSTFARLNRRLQGASGYNSTEYTDVSGAASVVRGVYKSLSFSGLEGVQGPYRLTGNENEEFVIVLAGTERVYINGQLVDRGEEEEYIIDYGLGELYFTNNLLIKDETRIVVEYEYIDQNFNRTLVAAEGKGNLFRNRLTIGATVIRQADGNNLLSQQTLTESDIDILRLAGDNRNAARISGAEIVDPNDEESNVLYTQIDTLVNGQSYTIFKNEPGSESGNFKVRFSNVGELQGSYNRIGSSVNGLLFEWVGPGEGEYEPFRTLPAPIEHQMAAINSSFLVSDNIKLFGEWAVSDFDQNRFSNLDDQDNIDQSYLGGIEVDTLKAGLGFLNLKAERRYSGSNFQFFERTRDVEFDRKWNLSSFENSHETTNELSARYNFNSSSFIEGDYGFIERSGFKGERQGSGAQVQTINDLNFSYEQDWIRSEDDVIGITGDWFRQQGRLSKEFRYDENSTGITPFIQFEHEERKQREQVNDSLTAQSLRLSEIGPGFNFESDKWRIGYSVGLRSEYRVLENELNKESTAIQHSVQLDLTPNSYLSTQNKVTVRNKDFKAQFEENGSTDKRSLLIRSNTNYSLASEQWVGNFLYEANTQRQALLQETFIEVGPEIGQYVWDDLNNDGVEQLDEFFLELTPNEGTYLRQFLPSDNLFPVIDLKVRLRNEFNPFGFVRGKKGLNPFFEQIKFRSRFDISENSTTNKLSDIYLVRLSTFRDSVTTISGRLTFEKELDIFPEFDRYDLSLRYNQSRSLNRRSSELQKTFIDALAIDFRYDITNAIQGDSKISLTTNSTSSSTISNRNFDIYSQNFEQGFGATLNRSWRTGVLFTYSDKEDRSEVNNKVEASIVKIRNTNRFFLWRKVQANSSLEFRNVSVSGASNAVSIFELTEGAGEGINLLWSLNSSYRVSNLIRLNLNYDGRTVKDRPTIHTARLTVKAVF